MIRNTIISLIILFSLTSCSFRGFRIVDLKYDQDEKYQVQSGTLAAEFNLYKIPTAQPIQTLPHNDPIDDKLNQQLAAF